MTLNLRSNFMHALIVVVVLSLTSCGDVRPRQLDGTWKLISINGNTDDAQGVTWEFEKDGDFKYCYDGDCYSGDWEWEEKGEEIKITLTDGGDTYVTQFDVDKLDKDVLEGTWSLDGDIYSLDFERD